ncbi:TetR/AcrR family transcriptional regulator [Sediminivirga luteola]|uniref:Transcriptional regulator n=1 Tax=Sediminivirga luteola TaxID=1774748 RepID=A0A8J2XCX8_9MICO|nr:TetR/AcrR family transcriptional regulator [Sediminivirga luteola]MCI2265283.1 TetR family transcriptional regulator [Sediminivirga luteola]GGA04632.1 transcriptional regulator [Sediminivirga luteola]
MTALPPIERRQESVPPARRRLAPEARRRQIVAAARAVMLRRGLAATSLRDIAREAEVSVGTVTYHFGGVDEILREVVTSESHGFYSRVVAEARAASDPRAGLRALMAPMFADSEPVREHWQIWADYWGAVGRRPEIAQTYAQQIRVWEDCCTELIEQGTAEGVFADVPARETAVKLAAYSDGVGMQRAQQVPGLSSEKALAWMLEFAGALLRCEI